MKIILILWGSMSGWGDKATVGITGQEIYYRI